MKLRPRPNVLIHLKTTIFKQENDLNRQNYKKIQKNKIRKNCHDEKLHNMLSECSIISFIRESNLVSRNPILLILFRIKSKIKSLFKTLVVTVFVEVVSSSGQSHIARVATKLEWTIFEWTLVLCKWLHSLSIFKSIFGLFSVYFRSFPAIYWFILGQKPDIYHCV